MAGNTKVIHGMNARVAYGTAGSGTNVDFVNSWSLSVTLDTPEANRQGQKWKEVVVGQAGWSATITGQLILSNVQQKALFDTLVAVTPGTLLTTGTALAFHGEDAADHYSGNSYVTGFTVNSSVGGVVDFSLTIQGTGVLTQTVA